MPNSSSHSEKPRPEPRRWLRATCAPGLSPWLAQEIEALGYDVEAKDHTGVELKGRLEDAMKLVLNLRTAYHVLQRFGDIYANDPDELYEKASGLPWERVNPGRGYVSVISALPKNSQHNSMFVNMRLKDAIVDRLNRVHGYRPDSGPDTSRTVVHLYWNGDHGRISLDMAGRKLSDRGYRKIPMIAPMRESIAAAVLLEAGYNGSQPLVVPMCGSGTIAIEAALIASGRPPGLLRSNFGLMHLDTFDSSLWEDQRRIAKSIRNKTQPAPIIVSDINPMAVDAARKNAITAGVDHLLDFHVCDFADSPMPPARTEPGIIILHGEYGERLGDRDELEATYRRVGDYLKQECGGWDSYVFTDREHAGSIGLKTAKRTTFEHGGMDCRLLQYEVYAGTRKPTTPEV